jgi:hypothetical protein
MTTAIPDWLRPELSPAERVLWTGQPRQGIRTSPPLIVINLIGLGILLIGLTWNTVVLWAIGVLDGTHESAVFRIVMMGVYLGTILLGLFMTVGIYPFNARYNRKVGYAITDRAAYIKRPRGPDAPEVSRHVINRASVIRRGGWLSRRSVYFDYQFKPDVDSGEVVRHKIGFHGLPDPATVLELLTKVRDTRT